MAERACPTPCDDDCDTLCHEAHEVPFHRTHDIEQCEDATIAAEYLHRIGADRPLAERADRARELTKDAPLIQRLWRGIP